MKLNNKGFSLVEILVAVAISTIVFGAITALIIFASNSSQKTNARVTLQNEAKDAVNHMEAYIIEAQSVVWDSTNNALVLIKDSEDAKNIATGIESLSNIGPKISVFSTSKKTFAYWYDASSKKLFFGECRTMTSDQTNTVDLSAGGALPTDNMYLLADHVEDFTCKLVKNPKSGKYTVNFTVDFKDNVSEYSLDKCVYLRNQ